MITVDKFVSYAKKMEDKFGIAVPAGIDPQFLVYIVDRMTSLTAAAQVVRPTTCPHCRKGIQTVGSFLDAINVACGGGTPQDPEMKISGHSLWFRGYMTAVNNIDLVGMCIAYPPQEELNSGAVYRIVVPLRGDSPLQVQALQRGQAIDLQYSPGSITEDVLADKEALAILVAAKKRAMQFLKDHIKSLPVLDGAKEENAIGN